MPVRKSGNHTFDYRCEVFLQVKACAEHPSIYNVVFSMLEQMWFDSGRESNLSKFIADLHGQIREYTWNKQHEVHVVPIFGSFDFISQKSLMQCFVRRRRR